MSKLATKHYDKPGTPKLRSFTRKYCAKLGTPKNGYTNVILRDQPLLLILSLPLFTLSFPLNPCGQTGEKTLR
jgi:hypothetical protein